MTITFEKAAPARDTFEARANGLTLVLDFDADDAYLDIQPGVTMYHLFRMLALVRDLGWDFIDPREVDPELMEDGVERIYLERA